MKENRSLLAELRQLIFRHHTPGSVVLPDLPGVMVMASHAPTPPFAHIAEPALGVVAQGLKRVVLGKRAFDYGVGQYLAVSVDLPLHTQVVRASLKEPYLGFGLTLRPEAIAALLLEFGAPGKSSVDAPGIAVSTLQNDLLDPIVRLLRLCDRPADLPVLAAAIEREILWRLLSGEQGAMVRQIGLADSRMAQIARTISWIRTHYTEALRIEDLARLTGMSVTSFHRHFRLVTSMSPIQFQKQIRLQAARSRLMSAARDVAEIGFSVGYDSPSQFSREYRRLFGVPPAKDAAALRQSEH